MSFSWNSLEMFFPKCPVLHIIFFVFRKCYRILLAVLKVYVCRLLIFTMSYSWLQFLTLSIGMYLAPIQHTCSERYKNNYFYCKFRYILSNGEIIFRERGARSRFAWTSDFKIQSRRLSPRTSIVQNKYHAPDLISISKCSCACNDKNSWTRLLIKKTAPFK